MGREEFLSTLGATIKAQAEPVNSSSVIAQMAVYQRVREEGFKVVLDGQGADELFGGYQGYPEFRLRTLMRNQGVRSAISFARAWHRYSGNRSYLSLALHFGATIVPREYAALGSWLGGRPMSPGWARRQGLRKNGIEQRIPELPGYPARHGSTMFLRQHLRDSLFGGDLARLLRHGDRSSMANSVESRVPYLHNSLVNLVLQLPEEHLVAEDGQTKVVLRKALRGLVPESVSERRDKIGFETPENSWLTADWESLFRSSGGLDCFEWLDRVRLLQATQGHQRGAASRLRWRALNLSIWADHFLQ